MSAVAAPLRPDRPERARPAVRRPERSPWLRLVPPPVRRAPRAPFVVVVIALLAGGVFGLLVLNTQRGQDAFTLARLQSENATLQDTRQELLTQVQQDRNPAVLASRAGALGMVPGGAPVFIGPDGKVVGTVPAGAPLPTATSKREGSILVAGTDEQVAAAKAAIAAQQRAAEAARLKAAQDKAAQDKAAQDKAAQDKAAQDKAAGKAATTTAAPKATAPKAAAPKATAPAAGTGR